MATLDVDILEEHSSLSPLASPTRAIGSFSRSPRCYSNLSSVSPSSTRSASLGPSSHTDSNSRHSSATFTPRSSSGSYTSRQSIGGRPRRRGYVRPQGTNFAASAQSRDSVMSLGSIAHLQYYFARTGLLDGKGGQLAKKKAAGTLDLSSLDTNLLSPNAILFDRDSSSMRSSPDFTSQGANGMFVESPVSNDPDSYDFYSDDDGSDPEMLPPTVSTYNYRLKPIPRPPTLLELKDDLQKALREATKALTEGQAQTPNPPSPPTISRLRSPSVLSSKLRRRSESDASQLLSPDARPSSPNHGWHELQGMHILDVLTLAIRAARQYYTAHAHPARLAAISSERRVRADLLAVMEVLRRMATRNFAGGLRDDEAATMHDWVRGVWAMLAAEEALDRLDLAERRAWTWLDDAAWPATPGGGPDIPRELAFLRSMDAGAAAPLPEYAASGPGAEPSEFLRSLQSGRRLVELHNAMVARSKRAFGAVPVFHADTAKPYRCAENLRFWIKAAELRWEVLLKVDVMGVVGGADAEAWRGFEDAVWMWAGRVRDEIAADMKA